MGNIFGMVVGKMIFGLLERVWFVMKVVICDIFVKFIKFFILNIGRLKVIVLVIVVVLVILINGNIIFIDVLWYFVKFWVVICVVIDLIFE